MKNCVRGFWGFLTFKSAYRLTSVVFCSTFKPDSSEKYKVTFSEANPEISSRAAFSQWFHLLIVPTVKTEILFER
jgi:hypothetical protein